MVGFHGLRTFFSATRTLRSLMNARAHGTRLKSVSLENVTDAKNELDSMLWLVFLAKTEAHSGTAARPKTGETLAEFEPGGQITIGFRKVCLKPVVF